MQGGKLRDDDETDGDSLPDEATPSLASCTSEESSESSSFFSMLEDISPLNTPSKKHDKINRRRVRVTFNDTVEVRVYSVTVAWYSSASSEHLLLTLGWTYNVYSYDIEESRYRDTYYSAPPKLSYEERRARLKEVAGYDDYELDEIEDEEERAAANEEFRILVNILRKPLSHFFQCHAMEPEDDESDEDYNNNDKEDGCPATSAEPSRQLRRSQSFYMH
jgi:hypothetical protein